MRKFALIMVLVASITMAFGQKSVRQSASNFLKDGKLDKAMEAINACILDPSTASDAKAWFLRGNIYLEISNTKDDKFKALEASPLTIALESYKKAIEYDSKKEYFDIILGKLDGQYRRYFDSAVTRYNNKQYRDAMLYFGKSASFLEVANIYDTLSLLNAALCAGWSNEPEYAKTFYLKLLKGNYKSPLVYSSLSGLYLKEKDSTNAFKYVRLGLKEYPNNLNLFTDEINIYLGYNIIDKAMSNLKIAMQKDTTNYTIPFALGNLYSKIVDDTTKSRSQKDSAFVDAEISFKRAIALKSDYLDAWLCLGSLYFNYAVPVHVRAKNLPLDQTELYNKLMAEAKTYYKSAVPYLEKVVELDPSDIQTFIALKQAYNCLGEVEKEKVITAKITTLRKK